MIYTSICLCQIYTINCTLPNKTLIKDVNAPDNFNFTDKMKRFVRTIRNVPPGFRLLDAGSTSQFTTRVMAYDQFGNQVDRNIEVYDKEGKRVDNDLRRGVRLYDIYGESIDFKATLMDKDGNSVRDLRGDLVTGRDAIVAAGMYTREQMRNMISERPSLLEKLADMIDPETFEFKKEFEKVFLSNTAFERIYGRQELLDTMSEIHNMILSKPKLVEMIKSKRWK